MEGWAGSSYRALMHQLGRPGEACPRDDRPGRPLPKGQHLLLVSRVAMRLNETAGPAGQPLSIAPCHVSHLGGDDLRHVSDPTFLHIERQDSNRSVVLPV